MTEFTDYLLSENDQTVETEGSDNLRQLALAMASQCVRTLDIVSRHLDPVIYDNEAFATAVRQLAIGSKYSRIRLLVSDPAPLVTGGHRLVSLTMQLSSFVSIRKPGPDHRGFNEAWLIADKIGYIRRIFSDRYDTTANFSDRRYAAELTRQFDDIWERAELDPNFRRLSL